MASVRRIWCNYKCHGISGCSVIEGNSLKKMECLIGVDDKECIHSKNCPHKDVDLFIYEPCTTCQAEMDDVKAGSAAW